MCQRLAVVCGADALWTELERLRNADGAGPIWAQLHRGVAAAAEPAVLESGPSNAATDGPNSVIAAACSDLVSDVAVDSTARTRCLNTESTVWSLGSNKGPDDWGVPTFPGSPSFGQTGLNDMFGHAHITDDPRDPAADPRLSLTMVRGVLRGVQVRDLATVVL